MADLKKTKITKEEACVLAFIQEAWESSQNWLVVFDKLKQQYHAPEFSYVSYVINFCAARGYLHILQWMRMPSERPSEIPGWSNWTCAVAALNGHLHVLEWLRNPVSPDGKQLPCGPCPWDERVCAAAALNGQVEVLEYLYEAEAPYYLCNFYEIHENCKQFIYAYGESWKSRRFDVPLN